MLPPLATVEELELRVGTIVDRDRAEAILQDASTVVRTFLRMDFMVQDDDGEWVLGPVPDVVKMVVLSMAQRVYLNPKGYASEQIGQYSYRRSGSDSGLGLSAAEKESLYLYFGRSVQTIGSVRPGLGVGYQSVRYVSDGGGGDLIPYEVI